MTEISTSAHAHPLVTPHAGIPRSSPGVVVAGHDLMRGTPDLFLNRELSWLEFNQRVVEEASDPSVPLLERLKFVAIASSNVDEFFMVRVAGLVGQQRDRVMSHAADGMTPSEQLSAIATRVARMRNDLGAIVVDEILPELAARGVRLFRTRDLSPAGLEQVRRHFHAQVLPVLTPLAIDPGHPFPHLRNKSLNLVAMLSGEGRGSTGRGTPSGETAFAVVQVPSVLPRLVRVPAEEHDGVRAAFILLDDLIGAHVSELFPGFECLGAWPFRVIRNFDLSIDEEEAEDLLESVKQEVRRRDRGNAVCALVDSGALPEATEMLREAIALDPAYVLRVDGPLSLPDLIEMTRPIENEAGLRDEMLPPQILPPFRDVEDVFSVIAQRDVLLHHPYESFDPVVHFIEQAASDPNVLAIKQTLYRTSGDSPIVKALMRAAENRKQVTALVEIKARFDEENNIQWARKMEEAGVHVVYGLVGLKTHAKAALVVRREGGELRRYVHLATGNYNPNTARVYTDLSFFTCRPEIGEDTSSLFNLLTSCTAPASWKKLVIAPLGLHERILGLIEREAANARAGRPARIVAKMNSLVDSDVILALYRASVAGVKIDLLVRGICCLRPGIPGVSENIRVRAILDHFLEHARIFVFEAGGAVEVYAASADWMQRNFQRRVEVLFPIEDPKLKARLIDEILAIELSDDVKARQLGANGVYSRVTRVTGNRCQQIFSERARAAAVEADKRAQIERPFIVRPVRKGPTLVPASPEPRVEGRESSPDGFPPRDPGSVT
jgi:polyphosphate kinase